MEDNAVNLVITLKKPFTFEETEYTSIDLSKCEEWTADDLIAIKSKFKKITGGVPEGPDLILPESNDNYIKFLAAEASGLPYELFGKLPARDFQALRSQIINFFLG